VQVDVNFKDSLRQYIMEDAPDPAQYMKEKFLLHVLARCDPELLNFCRSSGVRELEIPRGYMSLLSAHTLHAGAGHSGDGGVQRALHFYATPNISREVRADGTVQAEPCVARMLGLQYKVLDGSNIDKYMKEILYRAYQQATAVAGMNGDADTLKRMQAQEGEHLKLISKLWSGKSVPDEVLRLSIGHVPRIGCVQTKTKKSTKRKRSGQDV
jgi:hypothetical protein